MGGGSMNQDYNTQTNSGSVGGNMHQGGGSGKNQNNQGWVGGSMWQDYNTQINRGRVGGSMVQGGGFGSVQNNGGNVGGSMVQGGGFGNSQTNSGNVGGNMVQDYSAEVTCKQLKTRMENLCSEEKKVKPVCIGLVNKFHEKKC